MDKCFRNMWQEDPFKIERDSISSGSKVRFILWSKMLVNKKDSSSKFNGSRDENISVDVWLYQTR